MSQSSSSKIIPHYGIPPPATEVDLSGFRIDPWISDHVTQYPQFYVQTHATISAYGFDSFQYRNHLVYKFYEIIPRYLLHKQPLSAPSSLPMKTQDPAWTIEKHK